MFRISVKKRHDWQKQVEDYGYISNLMLDEQQPYWIERLESPFAFQFTAAEIESIYNATRALHAMCWQMVELVVNGPNANEYMDLLQIPSPFRRVIKNSWNRTNPEDHYLYGRFDLVLGLDAASLVREVKALEFNADTPTFLCELGHQWLWLEEMRRERKLPQDADQFNAFDVALQCRFELIGIEYGLTNSERVMHFVAVDDTPEDVDTCLLLMAIAQSVGITTKFTPLEAFGVDVDGYPVDQDDWRMTHIFKLYPWENLFKEIQSLQTWGLLDRIVEGSVKFVEPAWKALLSNKGIWSLMYREFPQSKYLLPSYFESDLSSGSATVQNQIHVRKPLIGREGASVSIVDPDPRIGALFERPTAYGEEGYIVQEFFPPEEFDGYYPVVGSWFIGDACGMASRCDKTLITGNRSIFVPHYIGSLTW